MNNLLTKYRIVEIFSSYQGEGANVGMPATFIRFGECNLDCPWCDTEWKIYSLYSMSSILERIHSFGNPNVILTGGEPTIQQGLHELINSIHDMNIYIALETNGLKRITFPIDYIATSPKRMYFQKYQKRCISVADEVRIVCDAPMQEMLEFCLFIEQQIEAKYYYLSPCEVAGISNTLDTIQILWELNLRTTKHWFLNTQVQKIVNIP